jgi:hypothetical protein
VAPKRAHTRANQEGPLATPVPDPEKIIRREKLCKDKLPDLQEHLIRYFKNTSSFISKEPLVESPSAETSSSQKIEIVSESLKGEEPSISSNVIDSISEHDYYIQLKEEVVGSPQQKETLPLLL